MLYCCGVYNCASNRPAKKSAQNSRPGQNSFLILPEFEMRNEVILKLVNNQRSFLPHTAFSRSLTDPGEYPDGGLLPVRPPVICLMVFRMPATPKLSYMHNRKINIAREIFPDQEPPAAGSRQGYLFKSRSLQGRLWRQTACGSRRMILVPEGCRKGPGEPILLTIGQ